MDTNKTGREPTEPTDAELLRDMWAQWMSGPMEDYGVAVCDARERGRQYLSGARPMPKSWPITLANMLGHELPDTPAPDEVAPKLGGNCATHLCSECGAGVLKPLFSARLVPALQAANTALSARVAELEAELKNIIEAKRTDRKFFDNDTEFASWAQNRCYFALNRVLSAPGKEPISE